VVDGDARERGAEVDAEHHLGMGGGDGRGGGDVEDGAPAALEPGRDGAAGLLGDRRLRTNGRGGLRTHGDGRLHRSGARLDWRGGGDLRSWSRWSLGGGRLEVHGEGGGGLQLLGVEVLQDGVGDEVLGGGPRGLGERGRAGGLGLGERDVRGGEGP